jgi:hypothetical protein
LKFTFPVFAGQEPKSSVQLMNESQIMLYISLWGWQEIVSIYPMLSPPTLTAGASNRVCNALALLQVGLFDDSISPWSSSSF